MRDKKVIVYQTPHPMAGPAPFHVVVSETRLAMDNLELALREGRIDEKEYDMQLDALMKEANNA